MRNTNAFTPRRAALNHAFAAGVHVQIGMYVYCTCQRSACVMSASQRTIESFFTSNAVKAKNTCIVERKQAATAQNDWSRSPVAK